MSDDDVRERNASNTAWIAGAIIAILIVIGGGYLLLRDTGDSDVALEPSPSPTPTATATATAEPTEPTEVPTTEPATEPPSPAPSETEPPAAEPTDEDVADFVAARGPADRTATGDVTGDGTDEVVLASIRNNAVHIEVGLWDGSAYQRAFRDDGGPAERVTGLELQDYNGRTGAEIVTEQRAGAEGRSISVWGAGEGGIQRQEGKGGCWDGFHTYGISGADIEPGQITATCDGSPQPPEAWSSDIYAWKKGRWTYERTQEAQG